MRLNLGTRGVLAKRLNAIENWNETLKVYQPPPLLFQNGKRATM